MNIYSRKQIWKKALIALGVLIILLSFWYTDQMVKNIAREERNKVRLWAEAIQKKARLVNYTDQLFAKLRGEERKKVELYVEASERLASKDPNVDIVFLTHILTDNTTVPVILTDKNLRPKFSRNLDTIIENDPVLLQQEVMVMKALYDPIEIKYEDQTDYLYYKDSRIISELEQTFADLQQSFINEVVSNSASVPVIITNEEKNELIAVGNLDSSRYSSPELMSELIQELSETNLPIEVHLQEGSTQYIYYEDSWILTQLKYYPFVQFGVIGTFILIAYYLFNMARRAEQNQVWVGLAKETAHQLGTPLSSLLGWVEYMKSKDTDLAMAAELEKDINRLEVITDRFSKIGSTPELHTMDLRTALLSTTEYMEKRSPRKIHFSSDKIPDNLEVKLNPSLFSWVIENLCKNAIDAMGGQGLLTFQAGTTDKKIWIDISDTGKGIPSREKKTIFEPGYTTKKRGWGLGLTLSKRIIEEYHRGKIFVKNSKPGEGTTFRITLNRA
ncbi:HAMP domain-containing histidine kinase [bacterium SCSIO 12741]|nr:HAMP domain-containing histidine kinase [bacterium SCSIO 12741]